MFTSKRGTATNLLRIALVPVVLISAAAVLCGGPLLQARKLSSDLDQAAEEQTRLLQIQADVLAFNRDERPQIDLFKERCEELVPQAADDTELHELVSHSALATEVEVLTCDIDPVDKAKNKKRPRPKNKKKKKKGELFEALEISISATCLPNQLGAFLGTLQGSKRLIDIVELEIVRDDESFPKILCMVEAIAYRRSASSSGAKK